MTVVQQRQAAIRARENGVVTTPPDRHSATRDAILGLPSDAELFAFGKAVLHRLAAEAEQEKDRVAAARALIDAVRPQKGAATDAAAEDLDRVPAAQLEAMAARAEASLRGEPSQ